MFRILQVFFRLCRNSDCFAGSTRRFWRVPPRPHGFRLADWNHVQFCHAKNANADPRPVLLRVSDPFHPGGGHNSGHAADDDFRV